MQSVCVLGYCGLTRIRLMRRSVQLLFVLSEAVAKINVTYTDGTDAACGKQDVT